MTVAGWREQVSERNPLYSPLGLRLVDEFTGKAPVGTVHARLERQVALGEWVATELKSVHTPSNVLTWPGLGRQSDPQSATPRRYRVRVEAELYRPSYLETDDGLEFDAPPWDAWHEPVPITRGPVDLYLFPASTYAFPTWVRVLRGLVEGAAGEPVPNALVHQGAVEKVLSDERGTFSLPLRWATSGAVIDATDARTGRTGAHTLSLPADLESCLTITIV